MTKISKIAICGLLATAAFSSCKKFTDVNQNPNNLTTTRADYQFSNGLERAYANQVSATLNNVPGTWTGYYAHSTSFTGGGNEKTYSVVASDFNAFGLYDNLFDLQYVIDHGTQDGFTYLKAPADVMQCYVFQQLVDLYGDIPYTEALKGVANISPAYTPQQQVYEDLIIRLDKDMTAINATTFPTTADLTAADIMFKLSKDKWLRFANTVKLNILMRQSFMVGRAPYITSNINTTLSTGYITENVLLNPPYSRTASKMNPFYGVYFLETGNVNGTNYQYRKMNKVMIDWLKFSQTFTAGIPTPTSASVANADTFRLRAIAYPATTLPPASLPAVPVITAYVGIPLGVQSGFSTASVSPIGPLQIPASTAPDAGTRPAMLMLKCQADFLMAEAAQRYGIVFAQGGAQACYEAGVLNDFRTCGAPASTGIVADPTGADAAAARYLARTIPNQGWVASTDKIRAILIQKWVSLCHINGLEGWSDYRKSSGSGSESTPNSPKSTVVAASQPEPTRFLYPQVELDVNASHVPAGQTLFTHLFWDVN